MDPPLASYSSSDSNVLFNDGPIKKNIDFSQSRLLAPHGLSYSNPGTKNGRKLLIRPLERTDYSKGYLHLLSQLTAVGDYDKEVFESQFDIMKKMVGCHYILVVEDPHSGETGNGCIIASASLIVERKFIHNAAARGRIEDVVVDNGYRGMHLGLLLLETLNMYSQFLGCYKNTLDCKESVLPYYSKLGYVNEGQCFLTQRFTE